MAERGIRLVPGRDLHLYGGAPPVQYEIWTTPDESQRAIDCREISTSNEVALDWVKSSLVSSTVVTRPDGARNAIQPKTLPPVLGTEFLQVTYSPVGGNKAETVLRVSVHGGLRRIWPAVNGAIRIRVRDPNLRYGGVEVDQALNVISIFAEFTDGLCVDVSQHTFLSYYPTPADALEVDRFGRVTGLRQGTHRVRVVAEGAGVETFVDVEVGPALGSPLRVLRRVKPAGVPDGEAIHLLILGEGFSDSEREKFYGIARKTAERMFGFAAHSPFHLLESKFCVWAGCVTSPVSGVTVPGWAFPQSNGGITYDDATGTLSHISSNPTWTPEIFEGVGLPEVGRLETLAALQAEARFSVSEGDRANVEIAFHAWRSAMPFDERHSGIGLIASRRLLDLDSTGSLAFPDDLRASWHGVKVETGADGVVKRSQYSFAGLKGVELDWRRTARNGLSRPYFGSLLRSLAEEGASQPPVGAFWDRGGPHERWLLIIGNSFHAFGAVKTELAAFGWLSSGGAVTSFSVDVISPPGAPRVIHAEYGGTPVFAVFASYCLHELGHRLDLGDEYIVYEEAAPAWLSSPGAGRRYLGQNRALWSEVLDARTGKIARSNIPWDWPWMTVASKIMAPPIEVLRGSERNWDLTLPAGDLAKWEGVQEAVLWYPGSILAGPTGTQGPQRKTVRLAKVRTSVGVISLEYDPALAPGAYPAGAVLYVAKKVGQREMTLVQGKTLAALNSPSIGAVRPFPYTDYWTGTPYDWGVTPEDGKGVQYPPPQAATHPFAPFTVGVFAGAGWKTGTVRASGTCKMRASDGDGVPGDVQLAHPTPELKGKKVRRFCRVCQYAILLRTDPGLIPEMLESGLAFSKEELEPSPYP